MGHPQTSPSSSWRIPQPSPDVRAVSSSGRLLFGVAWSPPALATLPARPRRCRSAASTTSAPDSTAIASHQPDLLPARSKPGLPVGHRQGLDGKFIRSAFLDLSFRGGCRADQVTLTLSISLFLILFCRAFTQLLLLMEPTVQYAHPPTKSGQQQLGTASLLCDTTGRHDPCRWFVQMTASTVVPDRWSHHSGPSLLSPENISGMFLAE